MRILLSLLTLLTFSLVFGQVDGGVASTSVDQKYDKSYVSPDLRSKHCISIGYLNAQTTPDQSIEPSGSWHIGYNYLILNQRKLKLALKDRQRTEMKAVGLHFTRVRAGEHYLMATLFNPLISMKGRALSLYFLSEYGLGYHYNTDINTGETDFRYHISLEILRLRVGRLPLYMHITGTYALSNKLLQKAPWEVGYLAGFRYYFYQGR